MIRDYHREPPGRRRFSAPAVGAGATPRRRWRRWGSRALVGAVLAGSLAWMGARAARAMPRWPYFRVAEVMVEGNLHLGRDEIVAALHLPPRANLLALDLAALGGRLAANPWVKEATLDRRLPDRLLVRLVERAPAAILRAGAAYLLSGDGVILEEVGDEAPPSLPVLRAPAAQGYAPGDRVAPQELNEALWAWRQLQLAPALGRRRPQEVALSPDGSYRVRMAPGPLGVRLRPEGLEPQLKRLGAVLALRGGALEDVDEVDLRFPEKVILRQRAVGPRPTGGAGASGAAAGRNDRPPWRAAAGGGGPAVPPGEHPEPDRPEGR